MILKNEELKDIKGGGMSFGLLASLVGLGAFLIGVLDGIMRPLSCYQEGEINMILNVCKLKEIRGGASNIFSATFFNAIARSLSTLADIGRSLGTSIRMIFSRRVCK